MAEEAAALMDAAGNRQQVSLTTNSIRVDFTGPSVIEAAPSQGSYQAESSLISWVETSEVCRTPQLKVVKENSTDVLELQPTFPYAPRRPSFEMTGWSKALRLRSNTH